MSTFTICQEISEGKDEKLLSFLLSPDVTKLATKEQIYDFLRTVIDWKLVFSGLASWQDEYNSLDDRFLKASLMGHLIQIASSGRIKYINEKGCDFFIPELNIGLEMKGFKDNMFNSRGDRTKELKIKNTQGNKSGYDVDLEKTFNYLMVLCPGYAGLSTFERTKERSYPKADGVYAVLDFNDIDLIKKSEKFVKSKINITDIKTRILIAAVEELKRVVENETV